MGFTFYIRSGNKCYLVHSISRLETAKIISDMAEYNFVVGHQFSPKEFKKQVEKYQRDVGVKFNSGRTNKFGPSNVKKPVESTLEYYAIEYDCPYAGENKTETVAKKLVIFINNNTYYFLFFVFICQMRGSYVINDYESIKKFLNLFTVLSRRLIVA